jgi:hypothetical protein
VVRWDPNARHPRGYTDVYEPDSLQVLEKEERRMFWPLERVILQPCTKDHHEVIDRLIGEKRTGTVVGYYNGHHGSWSSACVEHAERLLTRLCALNDPGLIDDQILEWVGESDHPYIVLWDNGYKDLRGWYSVISHVNPSDSTFFHPCTKDLK